MNLDSRFDKMVFPDVWGVGPKIKFTTQRYNLQIERITYTYPQPFIVARHNHSCFEIHYCSSGGGEVVIEDKQYIMKPGVFFITGPEVYHSEVSHESNPTEEYTFMLSIEPLKSQRITENTMIYSDLDNILDILMLHKVYFGHDSSKAIQYVKRIHEMYSATNFMNTSQFWILILHLLIATAENISNLPKNLPIWYCDNLDSNRMAYLDDVFRGYHVEMTQDIAANNLGVSLRQLNRITMKLYGMTFPQKYKESRLTLALSLLESAESLTIDEIAQKLNFSTQQYFSKLFKEEYGISPLQYRKDKLKQHSITQ